MESFTLYLKGRHHWNKRSMDSVTRAIEYFRLAIEGDPNFALAYAGLADSYNILADNSYMPPRDAYARMREAATKALELDDSLAEAHASYASVLVWADWNWSAGESEFRRAIELNGNYATAHQWYSILLRVVGRLEEALTEARTALMLDPLSPIMSMNVGDRLSVLEQYDMAIEYFRKSLSIQPDFIPALGSLAAAYVEKSMYEEATELVRKIGSIGQMHTRSKVFGAYVLAKSGRAGEARKILEDTLEQFVAESGPPVEIAYVYAALGEKDKVFEWLNKEYDLHGSGVAYMKTESSFASLRSDPRFLELLGKVGLEKLDAERFSESHEAPRR